MVDNLWSSAVKEAIRLSTERTLQHAPMPQTPQFGSLILEDSITFTENTSLFELTTHYLHAERDIPLPGSIVQAPIGLQVPFLMFASPQHEQSFHTAMLPNVSASISASSPPRGTASGTFTGDQTSGSTGCVRQATPSRRPRLTGPKRVCVQCHRKKKKCEGVFPCQLCKTRGEDCMERVGKRKRRDQD